MDSGARIRTLPPGAFGRRAPAARGFTHVEMVIVLGIVSLLSAASLASLDSSGVDLTIAQQEIQGCLDQAFHQAWAQGRNVTIAPGREGGAGSIPVRLPRRVKWGKPPGIPLPPGMEDPKIADVSGQAHPRITVTPRRTATAAAWFLHDGRETLCLRLSGKGHLQVLRYRLRSRRWERA